MISSLLTLTQSIETPNKEKADSESYCDHFGYVLHLYDYVR